MGIKSFNLLLSNTGAILNRTITLISFYFMNSFRYSMFNAQLIENLLTFPLVLCLPTATHDVDRIHKVQSTNGEKVFN